jgi:hypothetical protein
MKKLLYILISSQLLFGCYAVKDKQTPINDYLSSLNLKESDKIMIIQEKINNNVTIDIFKGKSFYYSGVNKFVKVEGVEEPLYDEKNWKKMKDTYEDKYIKDYWVKDNYWTLKDFKYKNIIFIKHEKFPDPGKYEEFDFKENFNVFSFSAPIYYRHNKYAAFTLIKTTTDYKTLASASILIMNKVKGKWIVLQKVGDGIYN